MPVTLIPAILLVEDNPVDAMLIQRAFRELKKDYRLSVVNDGALAVDYMKGDGLYADRKEYPFPSLILLDLSLPVMDGFQFLKWLREESALRHVPVVALSGSTFSPDVKRAYATGANSFLSKPSGLTELTGAVRELMEYWMGRCKLPDQTAPTQGAAPAPQSQVGERRGRANGTPPT
jgi:CheY-like chemotaxis protein